MISIAENIGLDLENDENRYLWLIEDIYDQGLPVGWTKEIDP